MPLLPPREEKAAADLLGLLTAEGFPLSPEQQQTLGGYLRLVADWNRRINLTSHRRLDRFLQEQVIESLHYLGAYEFPQGARVMDLGSGAGLPGIPLKIARPDLLVTLLEAKQKRAAFLSHAIRTLGLEGIGCVNQRAEWARRDPDLICSFHVVTARALGPLARTMIWALPFLCGGGVLMVAKGAGWEGEFEEIEADLPELGFGRPKIVPRRGAGRQSPTFFLVFPRMET